MTRVARGVCASIVVWLPLISSASACTCEERGIEGERYDPEQRCLRLERIVVCNPGEGGRPAGPVCLKSTDGSIVLFPDPQALRNRWPRCTAAEESLAIHAPECPTTSDAGQ